MYDIEMGTEIVKHRSLVELVPLIQALAEKVNAERLANKETSRGGVAKEVFELLLGMAGVTAYVPIVHELWEDNNFVGFALQQRDPENSGDTWRGLYHSVCTTARRFDSPHSALQRDLNDAYDSNVVLTLSPLKYLGTTIHDEPERRSACYTMMHVRRINRADFKGGLRGTWAIFTEKEILANDERVIDHNLQLLKWVLNPNREMFADVRSL